MSNYFTQQFINSLNSDKISKLDSFFSKPENQPAPDWSIPIYNHYVDYKQGKPNLYFALSDELYFKCYPTYFEKNVDTSNMIFTVSQFTHNDRVAESLGYEISNINFGLVDTLDEVYKNCITELNKSNSNARPCDTAVVIVTPQSFKSFEGAKIYRLGYSGTAIYEEDINNRVCNIHESSLNKLVYSYQLLTLKKKI